MTRHVRTSFPQYRRCSPQGSRLHHRTRLHRANILAAVPQIPRRPRTATKPSEAALDGKPYAPTSSPSPTAGTAGHAPKKADGKLDHHRQIDDRRSDDITNFVDDDPLPLSPADSSSRATGANTIEYKIGEIFGEIKNKIQTGFEPPRDHRRDRRASASARQTEKHELSHLYEAKIKNMGNAGRNGGEYYTPRPLIRAIIQVVKPDARPERIYDGAVGSAGFLCEAYDYLRGEQPNRTSRPGQGPAGKHLLRQREEKPRLRHRDHEHDPARHRSAQHRPHQHAHRKPRRCAGERPLRHHDSPTRPSAAKSAKRSSTTSSIKTGETAFLFLQHFIKMPQSRRPRRHRHQKHLPEQHRQRLGQPAQAAARSCNLHTILDCPGGTFQGAGVKTVVLFFDKGAPTRTVWYYQLDPGRNMGKTNPLNDADLAEFGLARATERKRIRPSRGRA